MARGKESFILYYDIQDQVAELSDEQTGILFKAILSYEIDAEEVNLSDKEIRLVFNPIKRGLKINKENYQIKCEKNSENGKKGGAPKGNTNASKVSQNKRTVKRNNPKQAKQADNDNGNGNGNEPEFEKELESENDISVALPPPPLEGDRGVKERGSQRLPPKKEKSIENEEQLNSAFDNMFNPPEVTQDEEVRYYGDGSNIGLTDNQYSQLKDRCGNDIIDRVCLLSDTLEATGSIMADPYTFLSRDTFYQDITNLKVLEPLLVTNHP